MKKKESIKECEFDKKILLRWQLSTSDPFQFCVKITCKTHNVNWLALAMTKDEAIGTVKMFPLVIGGLASHLDSRGECDAIPVQDYDCIISKIPPDNFR